MSYLHYANDTMIAVTTGPNSGRPVNPHRPVSAGSAVAKWQGNSDAYVETKILRRVTDGRVDRASEMQVTVPLLLEDAAGSRLSIEPDDRLHLATTGKVVVREVTEGVSEFVDPIAPYVICVVEPTDA